MKKKDQLDQRIDLHEEIQILQICKLGTSSTLHAPPLD